MDKQLIIFGTSVMGEIAYEYFTHDSPYRVSAFTVSEAYIVQRPGVFGLDVVPFERIEEIYPPCDYDMYVCIGYGQANKLRKRFYNEARAKGYTLASYVSSRAFVWHNVPIGDNCFIYEDNTVQPFVEIGNDVTLWSGNHIGHHSVIRDHVFVSSHVVISGLCDIGEGCFLGVNSTLAHETVLPAHTLVGMGSVVTKKITGPGQVWVGNPARRLQDRISWEVL